MWWCTLWITIGTSSYFLVPVLEHRILMIGIACAVSWYILSLPTVPKPTPGSVNDTKIS